MKKILATLLISLFLFPVSTFANYEPLFLVGADSKGEYNTFLGCLNCDKYNKNSIWNEFGTYGSEFNAESIWNEFGTYGSQFSSQSINNEFATYPPKIIDSNWVFYGYLTANKFNTQSELGLAQVIIKYYDYIQDDTQNAYDIIFN